MTLLDDVTCRRPIVWATGSLTDVGSVRTVNEDALLARPDLGLWAVADGMGGHQVGDIASAKIIEALNKLNESSSLSECVNVVDACLISVNQEMLDYADTHFSGSTMGSTVVSLLIRGHIGACLWVGDSRLYRLRNQDLKQLTRDHSQLEEMLEMGLISADEIENHPNKNVITRAVGVENTLYAEVSLFTTQVGDIFLLCSDGLYNTLDINEIKSILITHSPEDSATALIARSLEEGAKDNVSAVVVKGTIGRVSP